MSVNFTQTYWGASSEAERGEFVGLNNQGATCYMNSLLQTLYMTPEFRKYVFQWQYEPEKHGDPEDCIPLQLQLLFGKLQISERPFVATKSLTKSFGWDVRESFQQHDVQEFCRVLFDAIEQSMAETSQENMINELYEGIMVDYVKCMECENESRREDKFLDVSLDIKNYFTNTVNESVDEAFDNYIKPEKLEKDNQYMCMVCGKKTDALKGLKFKKFPYMFVIQLKRFDLDYQTMQRKKLNDKMTFPQVLNLNPYVADDAPIETQGININEMIAPAEEPDAEMIDIPTLQKRPSYQPENLDSLKIVTLTSKTSENLWGDDDKTPIKLDTLAKAKYLERCAENRRQETKKQIDTYLQDGEHVYELFSIMIHNGSAMGGHYYAYIKNFMTNRWYNFNDSRVKEIDESDIHKVFGGKKSKTGWGSGSANAYLLKYRKVSPDNTMEVPNSLVPPSVQAHEDEEREAVERERKETNEKWSNLHLKVFYGGEDKTIYTKKESTFREFKDKIIEAFEITTIADEDLRVRAYSSYQDIYQDAYEGTKLDKTMQELMVYSHKIFALETKEPGTEFEKYDPECYTVKVHVWNDAVLEKANLPLDEKTTPLRVPIHKESKLSQLIEKLEEKTGIPAAEQWIQKKNPMVNSVTVEIVSTEANMEKKMNYCRIFDGTTVYLERKAAKSFWEKEIEKESNRYMIKFNHPQDKPNSLGQQEYKNQVTIDRREKLSKLKELICEKIELEEGSFILKRGGLHGIELKDDNLTILQSNLMNGSILYLCAGTPSKPDEYRLGFYLATLIDETGEDGICYNFKELFEMSISWNCTIKEVKELVCSRANTENEDLNLNPAMIRLREKNSDRLTRTLFDEMILKSQTIYEKKQYALQIVEGEEDLKSSDMITLVKVWNPSTWELSAPKEVKIPKNSNLHTFGEKISQQLDIPIESLSVCRISYNWNFVRGDLPRESWYKMKDNRFQISGNPWFINLDGTLFVCKNTENKQREMTEDEKKKYSTKTTTYSSVSYGSSYSSTWSRPQEKGIKITVKKGRKGEADDEGDQAGDDETQASEESNLTIKGAGVTPGGSTDASN